MVVAGEYTPEGSSVCQQCEPGKACPDPTQDPVDCTAGTYSQGSATYCSTCRAGWQCPALDGSQNSLCPEGYYSAGTLRDISIHFQEFRN